MQTYRFMVPVRTGEVDENGEPLVEIVSAPGVQFMKPANDRFKIELAGTESATDEEHG